MFEGLLSPWHVLIMGFLCMGFFVALAAVIVIVVLSSKRNGRRESQD